MPLLDAGLPFVYGIQLPVGAGVFLSMTAPDAGYLPSGYYFEGELVGNQDGGPVINGPAIALLTTQVGDMFAMGKAGLTRDLAKGILAIRTLDCQGNRAAGVSIALVDPSNSFGGSGFTFTKDDIPVFHDPPLPTDDRAVAGYANVSPGNVQVIGTLADGRTVNTVYIPVRPGEFSLGDMRPPWLVPQ